MKKSKGFTLTEVLVVLILFSVSVSLLLLVFSRGVSTSLSLEERSERTVLLATLFWDLQRKVFGAERIYVEETSLYMITSGGSYYPGLVRCGYMFRDGTLFYSEDRNVWGEVYNPNGGWVRVGNFRMFRVVAVEGDREFTAYDGLPEKIRVYLDGEVFTFETLRQRIPSGLRKP